jgi:hypothetical protein
MLAVIESPHPKRLATRSTQALPASALKRCTPVRGGLLCVCKTGGERIASRSGAEAPNKLIWRVRADGLPVAERLMNDTVHAGMKSALLFGLVLVGACSSGRQADLPALKGIRSAAAEWALVNGEAQRGRLTPAYANGMREAAREEIAKQARALTQTNSPAAHHAAALQALPRDAPPGLIAPHVKALQQIETALESS